MKRYLLPNSAKRNPVDWERTKQTIQSLLSSSDAHDKLEDFVLEMIAKNGVPEVNIAKTFVRKNSCGKPP